MTTLYHLPSSQSVFIAVSGSTWTHKLWIRERGLLALKSLPSLMLEISALPHLALWNWNCFSSPRNTKTLSHPHPIPRPRPDWGYKENIEGSRNFLISLQSFLFLFLFFPNHSFKKHITFVPYSWHRVEAVILPSWQALAMQWQKTSMIATKHQANTVCVIWRCKGCYDRARQEWSVNQGARSFREKTKGRPSEFSNHLRKWGEQMESNWEIREDNTKI